MVKKPRIVILNKFILYYRIPKMVTINKNILFIFYYYKILILFLIKKPKFSIIY